MGIKLVVICKSPICIYAIMNVCTRLSKCMIVYGSTCTMQESTAWLWLTVLPSFATGLCTEFENLHIPPYNNGY